MAAGIEVNSSSTVCRKCGRAYGALRGYFPVSYAALYKGTGFLPYCKSCFDDMYLTYLSMCNDERKAARQMCRKLDLYWNDNMFDAALRQHASRSVMACYLTKINAVKQSGKCYDDTLIEEGVLWETPRRYEYLAKKEEERVKREEEQHKAEEEEIEIPDEVVAFWGPGYTPSMYQELEQRLAYWKSRLPDSEDMDIGTEALIRQICPLEISINRDRSAGKPVDKSINALNTLIGSANLKPVQRKEDQDADLENMPLGVGIQKWEFDRPLPATPDKLKDVRKTVKNITIWYLGHACKMAGIKNSYSRAYEEAMEELRVKKPEYENEDDDDVLYDFFNGGPSGK